MRPGAVGWGYPGQAGTPQPDHMSAAMEHALAAAAKDPDRVTDLLDELSRGRLWLPLPDDERPVTDGSAVLLPAVTYRGPGRRTGAAAPGRPGHRAQPGRGGQRAHPPRGVGYLAAALVLADGAAVRLGRPAADPVTLHDPGSQARGAVLHQGVTGPARSGKLRC
jgi:hypothetical protein